MIKNIIIKSQCFDCIHFNWDKKLTCKAFFKGIPDDIIYNKVDHTKPYKGDNGILFEPIKKN